MTHIGSGIDEKIGVAAAKDSDTVKLTNEDLADAENSAIVRDVYKRPTMEQAQVEAQLAKNKNAESNRKLRQKYAGQVFKYLVGYSGSVLLLLLLSGFRLFDFHLPESVLSFLVGSTAAAAIGLVYAVTNGLFNGKQSNDD